MGPQLGFKINDEDSVSLITGESTVLEIRVFRKSDWYPIDVNGLTPVLRVKRSSGTLEIPGSYHVTQAGIMHFPLSCADSLSLPVEKGQSMELVLSGPGRLIVVPMPKVLTVLPRLIP